MVAVFLALVAASSVGSPMRVAVTPFTGDGGAERIEVVEEALIAVTHSVSDHDLVSRYEIEAIAGLDWLPKDCREPECAKVIVDKLAVQWVLVGELEDTAASTILRLRLLDATRVRGKVEGAIGKAPEMDPDAIEQVVRKLFGIPASRTNSRYGRIRVRAERGSQIFLDGRDTGYGAPHLIGRITAGRHVVEVRYEGARGTKEIVVARGATTMVEVPLGEIPVPMGRLMVDADVPGSVLILDGKSVGELPQNMELAPGSYNVRIEAKALAATERMVAVQDGVPTVVNVVVPKWSRQQATLALAYRGYGIRCRAVADAATAGHVCGKASTARTDMLLGPVARYDLRIDGSWAARATVGLLFDARMRGGADQPPPAGTLSPLFALGGEWRHRIPYVWQWIGFGVEGYATVDIEMAWHGSASPGQYALLAGGGLRFPWFFVDGTVGWQLGADGTDGDYRVESRPIRWGVSVGREFGF